MAPDHESTIINFDSPPQGLGQLISTALALSFGISMAAAAMMLAAGILLEQF
jgi:hypothetical protein